ncbi:MAG: transglycosylase SLT domain-containing protein, partial [Blastocatellia bacterium]
MPQDQDPQITLEDFEERRRQYYGIPKGLAASLRQQESGGQQYDPKTGGVLTSRRQAKGRYQVLQSTADPYGLKVEDPFENIEASFRYLSDLHKQVDAKITDPGERWAQTLAGYHAGEGRLREINKTGALPSTSDGKIRTDDYVNSIMQRWQQYDQDRSGQTGATPQTSSAPISTARRLGLQPAEGMRFDLSGGKSQTPPSAPQLPKGQLKLPRVGPRLTEQERSEGLSALPRSTQEFAASIDRRTSDRAAMISPEASARLRKIEEFEAQPLSTQIGQQAHTYLAGGGAELSKIVRRAVGAGFGAAQALQGGKFENVDVRPESLRKWEEERQRELAAEKERYRPTLANEIAQGVIEAAPVAALATVAPQALGGGAAATIGTGAGISALSADWNDPRRAAAQTALGAVAPVAGGKLGSAVAGRIAPALANPTARAATNIAGEIGGGAAGNVLQSAAEQAAFKGDVDPRELAKQAIIGGALSAPGAIALAGRPAQAYGRAGTEPAPEPRATPPTPEALRGDPERLPSPPQITRPGTPQLETQGVRTPEIMADTPTVDRVTPETATATAQIAGEPVSAKWLNAQRRQAAELLGLDPDALSVIEENAPNALPQNLQTRPAGIEGQPAAAEAASAPDVVATASTLDMRDRPKPQFVADAEQRLSDAASGRLAGSGGQQVLDMAVVTGWKVYRAGQDFA